MTTKLFQLPFKELMGIFLLLLFTVNVEPVSAYQTSIEIKGKVTDSQKQPLPGVSVSVKAAKIATITDKDGNYAIRVPNQEAVLVYSFMSFVTVEKKVSNQRAIDIIMADSKINALDEIVVVGYGTQRRGDLTGAVSSIKAEELTQTKSISFLEAMQGKLAGVQISTSSGEPGAALNINIRGANSINAGTTPLYVIDGVQIDANESESASFSSQMNPLSTINPADIESIEVLKDASSTAIYGARGANGVVMITTKGGSGQSSLDLDVYSGFSTANKKFNLIGGQDYAEYRFIVDPNTSWGVDTDGNGTRDRALDVSGLKSHDWQDEVLRTGFVQNYNISYSNSTAKSNYAVSAGYLEQEGLLLNNSYQRLSTNFKVSHKATNKIRIGGTINAAYVLNSGVGSSGGQTMNFDGVIQNMSMFRPIMLEESGLGISDEETQSRSTPLDFVNFSQKSSPFTRLVANTFGEYTLKPGLTLRLSGGGVMTNSKNGEFYPSTTFWGFSRNGMAALRTSNTLNYFQSHTLNYNKVLKKKHRINALLGFETNTYIMEGFSMRAEGFNNQSINAIDNIQQAQVYTQIPTTEKTERTRLSGFGRLNYSYNSKYLFTATLRQDGSSVFGENNKFSLFPSGAFAWNASNEKFLRSQTWLSNLKLRTSFGVTGNDRIPPYQALATGSLVHYSGLQAADMGIAITSMSNPDLKWETTYQYDAGIDLSILKNRIDFTLDIYRKQTKDMLLYAEVPGQSGFARQYRNIGRVDNNGVEFSIRASPIRKKDFSWDVNFNITANRNKVMSLGGESFLAIRMSSQIADVGRVIVGEPLGTAYGYVYNGIYQLDDFVNPSSGDYTLKDGVAKRTGVAVRPGDFKFKDLDGDGEVDNVNDRTVISDSNPKHFGGLTNTFRYKNFDFSTLLQWSYGNDVLNLGRYRLEGYMSSNMDRDFWEGRWTPENPTNQYPRINSTGRFENSSYYVEDGSYLRVRNMVLGYNFKEALSKRLGLKNLRVYLAADNILTFTKYRGYDPEVTSYIPLLSGVDNISYPRPRVIMIGLNVKL